MHLWGSRERNENDDDDDEGCINCFIISVGTHVVSERKELIWALFAKRMLR